MPLLDSFFTDFIHFSTIGSFLSHYQVHRKICKQTTAMQGDCMKTYLPEILEIKHSFTHNQKCLEMKRRRMYASFPGSSL